MTDAATTRNASKLVDFQERYPGKIKILQSERDVASLNMDAVMEGGTGRMTSFDNADPKMSEYLADQLSEGNKIAIVAAGKTKLLFVSGKNIF